MPMLGSSTILFGPISKATPTPHCCSKLNGRAAVASRMFHITIKNASESYFLPNDH